MIGELFKERFIPSAFSDDSKREFANLRQGGMTTIEYYRKFTDLSRYHSDVVVDPVAMLCCFKLSIKKK